jgi:hypothetical protein
MLLANRENCNLCTSGQKLQETGSITAADIPFLNERIAFSVSDAAND